MPRSCSSTTIAALSRSSSSAGAVAIAKAGDVERDRRQQLQLRLGRDALAQIACLGAVAGDRLAQPVEAEGLQREPDLERAKATTEVDAVLAEPRIAAGEAPLGCGQIVRAQGERRAMQAPRRGSGCSPPRRGRAAICGSRTPDESARSMPARRGAISGTSTARPPKAASTWNQSRSSRHRSASAARSSIAPVLTVPAVTDDAERLQPGRAIGRDRCDQGRHAKAMLGIDRDQPQAVAAQAQELERLGDAAVRLARGVAHQPHRPALQPLAPDVAAGMGLPGGGQADHGRHRGATDEQAAGVVRQAHDLARPVDDLALDIDGRMLAAAEIGVERAARNSASAPTGVPEPWTQPMKRGWVLPVG